MPLRTNEFQRLIAVIQSHLDPGSSVVEPAKLQDRITSTQREVDIVVSGQVGAQHVNISIECRQRNRKPTVTWVEEMQAKHSRLPTNVLVLAAHKQFSREALRVANIYGIRCLVLNEVDAAAPDTLFPDVRSLWGKGWQLSIDRVVISVAAVEELQAEWFRAVPDTKLFLEDGSEWVTAAELANVLLRTPQTIDHMASNAHPEHTFLEFVWENPVVASGQRVCVEKVEPLVLRPVERFRVVAKCVVTVDEFPLRHGEFERLRVAWGTGAVLGMGQQPRRAAHKNIGKENEGGIDGDSSRSHLP